MRTYGLQNPFRLSAQATRQMGDAHADLTVYGETPWVTLARMAKAVRLQPGEHFVELGAGTGRNLLWMTYFAQVRATGFELVPAFVEHFEHFQSLCAEGLPELEAPPIMHPYNWFEADLQALAGDVFLLVGTCYDGEHRQQANACLQQLPGGTRVITVSYALSSQSFMLDTSFTAPFSWGKGTVFVQTRL